MTTEHEQARQEQVRAEDDFYEEAPRSSLAENIGVFVAIIALAFIGYAGFIWLTPGREFGDFMRSRPAGSEPADELAADSDQAGSEEQRCPTCNMFALRSHGAVEAQWSDGSTTLHDSWSCVAGWQEETGLGLSSARVRDITAEGEDPVWLAADAAAYRMGEGVNVPMSMPPFVAAYADETTAVNAAEDGGEVINYSALLSEFGISTAEGISGSEPGTDNMEVQGSSMDGSPGTEAGGSPEPPPGEAGGESTLLSQAAFPDNSCSYCGMFADRSMTHVVVLWDDGSHSQHDSFDCVFGKQIDDGLVIERIQVTAYDADNPGSDWLDARSASFLYDTSPVTGSMPPYVAAFASNAEAEAALEILGGELLDFNELAARWQQ